MATLDIFDVEHGACALLTADTQARMLIDCGRNVSTGWSPARHLQALGVSELELLAVTNYDEDHVDGLPELRQSQIAIRSLWRSKNVDASKIIQLKSEDGMGNGISELIKMAMSYTHPINPPINFGNINRNMFYNEYDKFQDENNLSAVIIITVNNVKVVFTGDMESDGFDEIMKSSKFCDCVRNASILIAPHHGRDCSVHEGFLSLVNPYWTVISDKGYMYDTQQTVPIYRRFSRGGQFRGEKRHVLTTRNDGTIKFYFNEKNWGAY